jgi:hypothetical protein
VDALDRRVIAAMRQHRWRQLTWRQLTGAGHAPWQMTRSGALLGCCGTQDLTAAWLTHKNQYIWC